MNRRFALTLVGLAVAAVLTGILLASSFGSAADTGDTTTTSDRVDPPAAGDGHAETRLGLGDFYGPLADFYTAHPGGRSRVDPSAVHLGGPTADDYATYLAHLSELSRLSAEHHVARVRTSCVTTADAAEHWIRETGHLPCVRSPR